MTESTLSRFRRLVARQVGYFRLSGSLERIEDYCRELLARHDAELARQAQVATAPPNQAEGAPAPKVAANGLSVRPGSEPCVNAIRCASADAYFRCLFNGVELQIPKSTLLTMVHCIFGDREGPPVVNVETPHLDWMISKLKRGQVFADVGAATGAMCLPISRLFEGDVRVVSFEPARTTNRVLQNTLAINGITNVEVHPQAVADKPGTARFCEYLPDETGQTPFLPEASALFSTIIDPNRTVSYDVPVTTLDTFFGAHREAERIAVMKIDVEGFEVGVIDGGHEYLRKYRPFIAIDIHKHPFQDGDTEQPVRERLQKLGYQFGKLGHVLTCAPA